MTIYNDNESKDGLGNVIVYVSSSLCRPVSKRVKSPPFRLVKAIPIDFFPHTQHCELIMLFERDKTPSRDLTQFRLSVHE